MEVTPSPESSDGTAEEERSVESLLNAADEAPLFGLNGRALILQAAQRAAKKRKRSHPASQESDSTKSHAAEPSNDHFAAAHEQQSLQPAVPTSNEASAEGLRQTKGKPVSDTLQPAKKQNSTGGSSGLIKGRGQNKGGRVFDTLQPATHHNLTEIAIRDRDQSSEVTHPVAEEPAVLQKATAVTGASRRSESQSAAATDALIDALDPHDQPLVAYINRSNVPRILRQGIAKRLAGQQLAKLLQDANMPVIPAAARSSEAAALRKYAAQAALAQEMSIYRKGIGKQVYMNNAARQQACPSFLPAEARPMQQQSAAENTAEVSTTPVSTTAGKASQHSHVAAGKQALANPTGQAGSQGGSATAQNGLQQHQDAHPHSSAGFRLASASDQENGATQPTEAGQGAAKRLQLVEAEMDWSGDTSLQQHEQDDENDSLEAESDAGWSDSEDEEYDPEGALLDVDSHILPPTQHSSKRKQKGIARDTTAEMHTAEHESSGRVAIGELAPEHTAAAVQYATLRFVKAILNPLYAAQVISRPVYKFVLLKVTNKVLQRHGADADTAFLVAESGQIQHLVQDYIRHSQVHGIDF